MSEQYFINRNIKTFKPNTLVSYQNENFKIINVVSFENILISNIRNKKVLQVGIDDLSWLDPKDELVNLADNQISDKDWVIALERYEIIKPLINSSTTQGVIQTAKAYGVHKTSIWNWLKAYRSNKSIMALIPKKRGWKLENSRLSNEIELVLKKAIADKFFTLQKPSISKTIEYIKAECYRQRINPPHENTIRRRLEKLNEYEKLTSREGKKVARDKYDPVVGNFPNADYPLAYVQIDHTPLDIEIVDDIYRQSIGRPYLTLAIDVFSRMVVGYHLSLDAPSATSVAMCIISCVLSKKKKLIELDIDATWNVEGVMDSIHSDNGSDFRTDHLKKACLKYGIHWEYRPIGGAKFGGHIERLLGVVNLEMHILEGSTFSNTFDKGLYDSSNNACLTFGELERYTLYWITKVYHQRNHSGIDMAPCHKWDEGIWGNEFCEGTGLKERVSDEQTLYLDFLPEFEATIQRHGVQKDKLLYFADCLRIWINTTADNSNSGRKKKFIFKRDPRDITTIWFLEPNLQCYFKIPVAKKEIPPLSLEEYKYVRKYLKDQRISKINQDDIYEAILHLREYIQVSKSKTTKQRRLNQKRKENEKNLNQRKENNLEQSSNSLTSNGNDDFWAISLTPFNDLR